MASQDPKQGEKSHSEVIQSIAVTGAGAEIGGALCSALAAAGVEVVMIDRKERQMSAVYDAICSTGGPEPLMVEFDLVKSEASQFEQLGSALQDQVPALHGLVHAAFWGAPLTPIALSDLATWNRVLDQNLARPVFLTRVLYPLLQVTPQSAVIFSTLDCGTRGRAYWGSLGAAFAGIGNVAATLEDEWSESGISVGTVDCSTVRTAVRKKFYPAATEDDLTDPADPAFIGQYLALLGIRESR